MEPKRDILEVNVLFVGAGPANLSGALHLSNLIKEHNENIKKGITKGQFLDETSIAILEKGKEVGSHIISGCILDPSTLEELIPDYQKKEPSCRAKSKKEFPILFYRKRKDKNSYHSQAFKQPWLLYNFVREICSMAGQECRGNGC